MNWLNRCPEGVAFKVRIVPRAARSEACGVHGDGLKIRLQAPPVEGRANRALVDFLAAELGVRRSRISIVAGETSRTKRILVRDVTPQTVARRFEK